MTLVKLNNQRCSKMALRKITNIATGPKAEDAGQVANTETEIAIIVHPNRTDYARSRHN